MCLKTLWSQTSEMDQVGATREDLLIDTKRGGGEVNIPFHAANRQFSTPTMSLNESTLRGAKRTYRECNDAARSAQ